MSYKDLEEQLNQLEKRLSAAEGATYRFVMLTLPFCTPIPPTHIAKQWLSECSVEIEDLMVARHRNSDVKLPVLHFGDQSAPSSEWLVLGYEVRTSMLSSNAEAKSNEWIHPLLISRYRQWALSQN